MIIILLMIKLISLIKDTYLLIVPLKKYILHLSYHIYQNGLVSIYDILINETFYLNTNLVYVVFVTLIIIFY